MRPTEDDWLTEGDFVAAYGFSPAPAYGYLPGFARTSTKPPPDAEAWRTALHESGHAVAAVRLGFKTTRVTIVPDGDFAGHTTYDLDSPFPDVRRSLVVKLAGLEAERLFGDFPFSGGCRFDFQLAYEELIGMSGPLLEHERGAALAEARDAARRLVEQERSRVYVLAHELMLVGTLSGDSLELLLG